MGRFQSFFKGILGFKVCGLGGLVSSGSCRGLHGKNAVWVSGSLTLRLEAAKEKLRHGYETRNGW